jgi:hypothetical protein
MTDQARYPGYDVLAKRATLSWNDITRRVIDRRLAVPRQPRHFNQAQWATLQALCARILPQPGDRPPIPLAAYVDQRLVEGLGDGYRFASMPDDREAWRRGLAALDAEAETKHGKPFHAIGTAEQDALIGQLQRGELQHPAWGDMPQKTFFAHRVIPDITRPYYAHPTAWNEIGFGGPASPRGYVRMGLDRRDPWEAAEAKPGQEQEAARKNARVG